MAEKNSQMVNGDVPHSAFVDHIASYPLVSASYDTYKSNPLGANTLILLGRTYDAFIYPLVFSRLAQDQIKPVVSPYLSKADGFADSSLSTIDQHFPIIKSKPEEIQSTIVNLVKYPFVLADQERQYVLKTYGDQYKKVGGSDKGLDLVATGKALIGTGLVATSETLNTVAGWLAQQKKVAEEQVDKVKAEVK